MDITYLSKLANLPVSNIQVKQIIDIVENIQSLDTSSVEPTFQVTGLKNVTRSDEIDKLRMFSQEQALSNAKKVSNGYFVVPAIFQS